MPNDQRNPVGVTMRPDFLRFVHDRILRGEEVEAAFLDVPVFADPRLPDNFRVFYTWDEFLAAVRQPVISGETLRFVHSRGGLGGIEPGGLADNPTRPKA